MQLNLSLFFFILPVNFPSSRAGLLCHWCVIGLVSLVQLSPALPAFACRIAQSDRSKCTSDLEELVSTFSSAMMALDV